MSDLFISRYLDEGVDILLADLIRARGFNVLTTRDEQQLGADDAAQLKYATQQHAVFFTDEMHNQLRYI